MSEKISNKKSTESILDWINASPLQEMMERINASPLQEMIERINASPLQEMMERINASPLQEMMERINASPLQEMMERINASPLQEMMERINVSPLQEMMERINVSPLQEMMERINASPLQEMMERINASPLQEMMERINVSPLQEMMERINASPLQEMVEQINTISLSFSFKEPQENEQYDNLTISHVEASNQYFGEYKTDGNSLKNKKNYFSIKKIFTLVIIYFAVFFGEIFVDIIKDVVKLYIFSEIEAFYYTAELESKTNECTDCISEMMISLKNYRYIQENIVDLKFKPKNRSLTIEQLPKGTIIQVLDQSNRTWLLVKVNLNGVIEIGWVLRKHTDYFK